MNYFGLGDKLDYPDLNAIVYLLRKFKRLTSELKLGSSMIESDYGNYSVSGGLTSVGGNFILEDDVTISSINVLRNCFYTFMFTVIDVNLSGTVNKRIVSVTGDTGDNGVLEVVLEPSLLESDEVLLPEFSVDIVFDPHEYYTPVSVLDITLESDKRFVVSGEVATVTATVLDDDGEPIEDLTLQFNVNGVLHTGITDENGQAFYEYTGTGAGWVTVTVSGESIRFYDGEVTIATVTWNNISLGSYGQWLPSTNEVIIDWGDGTSDTVKNPNTPLTHTYTDSESSHTILLIGNVTSLGGSCFSNTGLTSITIPSTVTNLGNSCFSSCTGLTSITIPSSVTSIGNRCFQGCTGLTSITVPNSVTSIGEVCFMDCTGLASVTLPSNITSLKPSCFQNTGLTSITIPDGVTILGANCFSNSASLTTVMIPSSVTDIGRECFKGCTSLVNYQLYWTGTSIIVYDSGKMPNNEGTKFIVPKDWVGAYTNMFNKYPSGKVFGRGEILTLTCESSSIPTHQNILLYGYLRDSGTPMTGKTIKIYDGSTLIATTTTDSNGKYTFWTKGQHLGVGEHTLKAVYGTNESNTVSVTVTSGYTLELTCSTPIIQSGDSTSIVATVKNQGSPVRYGAMSYVVKHGSTTLDSGSVTIDSSGKGTISYSGAGVGEVDVEVTYQDIGIYLQETYEVYDCTFLDHGTSIKHNDNWSYGSNISVNRGDTFTTVSETSTNAAPYRANNNNPFTDDFIVEWDNYFTPNGVNFFLFTGTSDTAFNMTWLGVDSDKHTVRLEVVGLSCKAYVDNVLVRTISLNNRDADNGLKFRFQLNNDANDLKYSNFKVYSI